jgi:distribution and morphology protein 12
MSFEIFWDKINTDASRDSALKFLNSRIEAINDKPSFIGAIVIEDINFGTATPEIDIIKIEDPYPIFYEAEDEDKGSFLELEKQQSGFPTRRLERLNSMPDIYKSVPDWLNEVESSTPTTLPFTSPITSPLLSSKALYHSTPHLPLHVTQQPFKNTSTESQVNELATESFNKHLDQINPNDVQLEFQVSYRGDMSITIRTDLILNYPTPNFMSLPVKLTLKGFSFSGGWNDITTDVFNPTLARAILAYVSGKMNFCFIDSEDNERCVVLVIEDVHLPKN